MMRILFIITLIVLSVISDIRTYKVKNNITLTFAAFGLVYCMLFDTTQGLLFGALGFIIPLILLIPLYALNMLGAGDVKLFCAIGTFIGVRGVIYTIAYSFLCGLAIAILIMIIQRSFFTRMKRLYEYFKCCILCMKLMPYEEFGYTQQGRMHFSIPIALGTLLVLIL